MKRTKRTELEVKVIMKKAEVEVVRRRLSQRNHLDQDPGMSKMKNFKYR